MNIFFRPKVLWVKKSQYFAKIVMYEAVKRMARRGNENLIELPSDPSLGTVFDSCPCSVHRDNVKIDTIK